MTDYHIQTERIKTKLEKARHADSKLKAFGASSHAYDMGTPVDASEIKAFEAKYAITLPESYKAFLLYIGNGGRTENSAAAGPFYGIYPFGKHIGELVYEGAEEALKNTCILAPDMTTEEWEVLRDILEDDDLSEQDYVKELGRIYGGILPIGSQGCTYLHALVINGKHKGKVVNLDHDNQQPRFCFEAHFLDWYERWLDEIIDGDLLVDNPGWFGYVMGGTQEDLVDYYTKAKSVQPKYDALLGLLRKRYLSEYALETLYQSLGESKDLDEFILQLMVKFKYKNWKARLVEFAEVNLMSAFKFLYWYERENCREWLDFIVDKQPKIDGSALFHHYLYLLKECGVDYGPYIKPFVNHKEKRIRISTLSALGNLPSRNEYTDEFILGLQDDSDEVVRVTLIAIEGLTDEKLLPYFQLILERFPKDKHYIFPRLKRCLKHFNADVEWLKTHNF